jgi:hypothetical protein
MHQQLIEEPWILHWRKGLNLRESLTHIGPASAVSQPHREGVCSDHLISWRMKFSCQKPNRRFCGLCLSFACINQARGPGSRLASDRTVAGWPAASGTGGAEHTASVTATALRYMRRRVTRRGGLRIHPILLLRYT